MGKASELDDWLDSHPLAPEEIEARDGPRPKLRLAPDVLAETLDSSTSVKGVLDRVAGEGVCKIAALHDAESGATAVAVPLEQYLELVTSHIRDRSLSEVTLDNRALPSDTTLAVLGVEQVDPQATWLHMGGDSIG